MSHREKQQRVYDKFRSYVHNNMRGKNGSLTVVNYSQIPAPGPTHMKIELENCFQADGELFELVKRFHPNASLVVKENVLKQGSRYIANIPWQTKTERKQQQHPNHSTNLDLEEPNVIIPMLWSMALMATVVAASFTTDYSQWATVFGW